MVNRISIAAGLLRLPDGRIILNRRDKQTPVSSGLLAFYGGHVEPGETPHQAVKREIGEETSLDISNLDFKPLGDYDVKEVSDKRFHLFEIQVDNDQFKVYEGDRSETYSRDEILARKDITLSVRYALENIVKK